MTNKLKVTKFSTAVRGYHYHGSTWFLEKEEQLVFSHDFGNAFDIFAIKTCKPNGTVVGHLPREILRSTKFLFDRGVQISAIINRLPAIINRLPKVSVSPRWFGDSM